MSSVLPDPSEAHRFAVDPSSITWRRAGDARAMTGAGTALMLQVAHPTVAGGVRDYSDFVGDPWGRLFRTLDYVNLLVYGGPERAAQTGRRMRAMHTKIKGVDPQGRRYHALEPEAYAWVHATLAVSIVAAHQRFGRPMTPEQTRVFWSEWRGLGRLLGIRERDLPESWGAFQAYVAEIIDTRLERNDVVDLVLQTIVEPAAPPIPGLGPRTWGTLRRPAVRTLQLATVGLLPEAARSRLDLHLTPSQERELAILGAVARATTPVMPRSARAMGPAYLKWRRRQIDRGHFGSGPEYVPTPRAAAA
ncbi:oxygenase MpaB family protein [Paraconexibacter sp.]|uniref:oxygenase MpaB family protein n=1 Tax=Paraconexibacter sp. TaxID=2949640 RepID=UPI0035657707